jgi:hypothetical protein
VIRHSPGLGPGHGLLTRAEVQLTGSLCFFQAILRLTAFIFKPISYDIVYITISNNITMNENNFWCCYLLCNVLSLLLRITIPTAILLHNTVVYCICMVEYRQVVVYCMSIQYKKLYGVVLWEYNT